MDYIVRATAAHGYIRAFAATTRDTVEEMRRRHNTTPVASAATGRLMTAAAMMGTMLKGEEDNLSLTIRSDGAIGGISVFADSRGRVKGFPYNPEVPVIINAQTHHLDVGKIVGKGVLTVVKDMGLKEPYSSQVNLQTGEIGDDLAYYFAASEQVPSSVGVGVLVDTDDSIRQAGGFIIQLMPGVSDAIVSQLEYAVTHCRTVTEMLEDGDTPETILRLLLGDLELELNDRIPVQFYCNCSKERVSRAILSLGAKELQEMIDEGKPVEVSCDYCGSQYTFSVEELKEMVRASGKILPY